MASLYTRLFPVRTLPTRALARLDWFQHHSRRIWRRSYNRKVDFLIIGAAKAGTTALDAYLRQHPEVCMADMKEVKFFYNDRHFKGKKPDYQWYHIWFSPKPQHKVLGDASPGYEYHANAIERVPDYNPKMKMIYLLRDPAARAYSHWNAHRVGWGQTASFWEALMMEVQGLKPDPPPKFVTEYIDRGRYPKHLDRLWRCFPKEQTLILKTEELSENPQAVLDRVGAFLGVRPYEYKILRANVGRYEETMGERERAYLAEVFEPEIQKVEELLGWDCSDWRPDRVTTPDLEAAPASQAT